MGVCRPSPSCGIGGLEGRRIRHLTRRGPLHFSHPSHCPPMTWRTIDVANRSYRSTRSVILSLERNRIAPDPPIKSSAGEDPSSQSQDRREIPFPSPTGSRSPMNQNKHAPLQHLIPIAREVKTRPNHFGSKKKPGLFCIARIVESLNPRESFIKKSVSHVSIVLSTDIPLDCLVRWDHRMPFAS